MGAVTNNGRFTSVTTNDSSPAHIKDGIDFPHTGLLKALSLGMKGNYVISGFNITSTTATSLTVASGVVMRVGKRESINGATLTLDTTYTNGYHLIVAPTGGTVVLRNPDAQDRVADYNDGDVIIGIATHTGNDPMQIQFLTGKQTENSLTIGRNDSGYTESLTIQSNSGDVTIKATEEDKDIIFNVNDGGSDTEVMRIDASTSRVGIGLAAPTCELEVRGSDDDAVDLKVSRSATQFTGIRNSDLNGGFIQSLSEQNNRKNFKIDNVHNSGGGDAGTNDFIFRTGASSSPTEIVRITEGGLVGIGTDAPQKPLHIKSNTAAIMRLQDSSGDGAAGSLYIELWDENSRMGYLGYGSASNATLTLRNEENGDLTLGTNSSTRLTIQSGGDVVVSNNCAFRAPELQTDSKSASYTLDASDAGKYFFITGSSTVITLPASPNAGQHYTLLSNDSNGFTLRTGTGSSDGDTMNGAQTDISVSTFNGVSCISDGTNWVVLGA